MWKGRDWERLGSLGVTEARAAVAVMRLLDGWWSLLKLWAWHTGVWTLLLVGRWRNRPATDQPVWVVLGADGAWLHNDLVGRSIRTNDANDPVLGSLGRRSLLPSLDLTGEACKWQMRLLGLIYFKTYLGDLLGIQGWGEVCHFSKSALENLHCKFCWMSAGDSKLWHLVGALCADYILVSSLELAASSP